MSSRQKIFESGTFLTDGGLETTLIFLNGRELNHFAAFELLNYEEGKQDFIEYYKPYLDLAKNFGVGFILETPTWRANPDWGYKLGYSPSELKDINKHSVMFMRELTGKDHPFPLIVSGNIGPRGDGYKAGSRMSADEAHSYHTEQIRSFSEAGADIVSALTMTYTEEAIGIVTAAMAERIPVVISFTVETDGKLPGGEKLSEAILITDAATDSYPLHYMINCAHPEHFKKILEEPGDWKSRIRGIRANASTKSHAELDESETLDRGDCHLLAEGYRELKKMLPELRIYGGCCGTDHSHLEEICNMIFTNDRKDAHAATP